MSRTNYTRPLINTRLESILNRYSSRLSRNLPQQKHPPEDVSYNNDVKIKAIIRFANSNSYQRVMNSIHRRSMTSHAQYLVLNRTTSIVESPVLSHGLLAQSMKVIAVPAS